uniref:Palmitoyltransferase n=1 Tax=Ditylenchus dipsaci TaxID=166011 RepID=A0A915CPC7_9BILA
MDKCLNNKCVKILISVVRWIPVLFITLVVCWGYYAYVFELCFNEIESNVLRAIYLALIHVFLFCFLWAYFQTVMTPIGSTPKSFVIPKEVKDDLSAAQDDAGYRTILGRFVRQNKIPVANRAFEGGPRFCIKCSSIKPDRGHHCSVCGQCVLKFDHHCPWVNTCINFRTTSTSSLFGLRLLFVRVRVLLDLAVLHRFLEKQ